MLRIRIGLCALLLVMLLGWGAVSTAPAFANKYLEFDTVQLMDPTWITRNYVPVNIMVRGRDLLSDAPGIAIQGRTLLPVADIFDSFGIPYRYDHETKQITFTTPAGQHVVVTLDDPYALVDGKRVMLPDGIAARPLAYRTTNGEYVWKTYVPVRFIAELLQIEVFWLGATRTAAFYQPLQTVDGIRINYRAHFPEIRVKTSGPVDFVAFDIEGSSVGAKDQIVIDLQSSVLRIPGTENGAYVEKIHDEIFGISQFTLKQTSTSPYTTRLTIDQNEKKGYDITYDEASQELVVRLMSSVLGARVHKMYGADTVVIDTTTSPAINVRERGNLLIVDFLDANLKMDEAYKQIEQGKLRHLTVKELSTAEIQSDYPSDVFGFERVTRMIIELNETVEKNDYFFESRDNQAFVYFSDEQLDRIAYNKGSRDTATLTVSTRQPSASQVYYDEIRREVSFFLTEQEARLTTFHDQVGDSILTSYGVRAEQGGYRVTASLADNTTYQVQQRADGITLSFVNEQIKDSKYRDIIIVVDAGHGGEDPGAVGTLVQEKELALRASLYLEEKLAEKGFRVFMTRKNDTYVGLFERGTIAENIEADVFVSVHINAHTRSSVSGIETIYGTETDKILASMIQTRLMNAFPNSRNRGVVEMADLVVLRTTSMPSVLVELGFISNEEEQERMMQDWYMRSSAEAMADGIVEFVDTHLKP